MGDVHRVGVVSGDAGASSRTLRSLMCSPTQFSALCHLGVFMEVSLHRYDQSNHWPVAISSTLSPSPLLKKSGAGAQSSNPLLIRLVSLATSPQPAARPTKCHLISTNPGLVEWGMLWITKDTPITQEIPGVLETLDQEPGSRTKYIFLISQ